MGTRDSQTVTLSHFVVIVNAYIERIQNNLVENLRILGVILSFSENNCTID